MGKALSEAYPAARQVFEAADDALGMKLSTLCFEGTEEELRQTEITQPAILTHSIAVLRALQAERPELKPQATAGHSLGEWSALVAVGALDFADAVRLVHTRGKLMQAAVPQGEGAMAAILGLTRAEVEAVCAELAEGEHQVWPANFNAPNQIVISGPTAAVAAAQGPMEAAGAMKFVALTVSAPFHCPMMQPAADGLRAALESIEIGTMSAPVITNVAATPNLDTTKVKDLLVAQVTAPVRWVECFEQLAQAGTKSSLELGPNKVLMGLGRRIERGLKVIPVGDPAGITKALAHFE